MDMSIHPVYGVPIHNIKQGKRGRSKRGLRTPAQSRDKRFREVIEASHARITEGSQWLIFRVSSRKALYVGAQLSRDLAVVLPEVTRVRQKNQYTKTPVKRKVQSLPGFIYVGGKDRSDFARAKSIKIVENMIREVVGPNGRKYFMDSLEISPFLININFDLPKRTKIDIRLDQGDRVRITYGPYVGQICRVKHVKGNIAHLELDLFGRATKMQIPVLLLEKVDG